MRKTTILILGLITCLCFSVTAQVPITAPSKLQQCYTSQLGVREATGKNDGKQVEMYLRTVNLGKGYPWCAAFVKYNLQCAGIVTANRINGMALSCHNANAVVFFKNRFYVEPRAGDVGTLYYPALKRIGHTFFFDHKVNSTVYESVEGNTNAAGSREGDGVYRKFRSFKATYSLSRWI